jgi:hypothetical protein
VGQELAGAVDDDEDVHGIMLVCCNQFAQFVN